jgi:hypothetical protein
MELLSYLEHREAFHNVKIWKWVIDLVRLLRQSSALYYNRWFLYMQYATLAVTSQEYFMGRY